jgi:hypothetical protein
MPEIQKKSVDTPKRGRIVQVLAMCAALAGGCATTGQNSEPQTSEAENNRPEWADGPSAFEKDGYIYGVGKAEINESEDLMIPTSNAYVMSEDNICKHSIKRHDKFLHKLHFGILESNCTLGRPSESVDRAIVNVDGKKYLFLLRRYKIVEHQESNLERHFREEHEKAIK